MKTVRRDISGTSKDKLDRIPEPDLVLFHWSPTTNRQSIERVGLVPGKLGVDEIWNAPFICFSEDPTLAWQLSGRRFPEIKSWDLWGCNTSFQTSFKGWEIITDTYFKREMSGLPYIKEYRVYYRVYKRDLEYIATRTVDS